MAEGHGRGAVNPFHVQWNSRYFVGREDELRVFEQNLHGLRDGQQSHLLVAGVHGTGKSFYLNKLAELAKSTRCIGVVADCPESLPIEQARSILRGTIRELQLQVAAPESPPSTSLSTDFEKREQSQLFALPRRTDLDPGDLQEDLRLLVSTANGAGYAGIVICIDEGQRIARTLLSCLKNSVSRVPGILIVLSWRLASDTKGAVTQARQELMDRISDTEQDKDIGAAAFFASATAMGPFKTDQEVDRYFAARLAESTIKFSSEVTLRLSEISSRVPRPMTALAHAVYDTAVKMKTIDVEILLLNECFRVGYPGETKHATDFCADLSVDIMAVLKSLCRFSFPATALDLVREAFPETPSTIYALMAQGVETQLDKLCQATVILKKADGKYDIVDSFHRYALKLALGTT